MANPTPLSPAVRPLLERVARMGDCIGANTVAEISTISDRARAWLQENPPGQPVAIEPRGCPIPGACACVESAPPADGEVADLRDAVRDAIADAIGSSAYDCTRVWNAWNVGTMGQDNFEPIVESDTRLDEITDAAIQAIASDRAVALLSRQVPQPVPVSERLPGPGDCDAEGRCWWLCPASFVANGMCSYWCLAPADSPRTWWTHWLPADSLPLPHS